MGAEGTVYPGLYPMQRHGVGEQDTGGAMRHGSCVRRAGNPHRAVLMGRCRAANRPLVPPAPSSHAAPPTRPSTQSSEKRPFREAPPPPRALPALFLSMNSV